MDSGWSPACLTEPSKSKEWGVLKTTAVQPLKYQEEQNKGLPPNLEPRPEHEVMDGDILFTRAGPINRVGILCVARPTRAKLMISDKIIRFHLIHGIDPDFAALAMNAGYSSLVVEGLKSGMAASQVNISQPKLEPQ
jgi:type I restriction enzyme S subunit